MEQILIVLTIAIIASVIVYRISRSCYWKGRFGGWKACEDMIMDRAKKSSKYNHEDIWKDLIQ